MKLKLLCLFFALTPLILFAQSSDTIVVPKSVKSTFSSIYPNATNVKWYKSTSFSNDNVRYVYKVKFRQGIYNMSATTDTTGGNYTEFTQQVFIPENVWTKFHALMPTAEVSQCIVVNESSVKAPAKGYFDIEFTYLVDTTNYSGTVYFDSVLNVVQTWKAVPPSQLPAEAKKYIDQNFKDFRYASDEGCTYVEENNEKRYVVALDETDISGSVWLFFDGKGKLTKKECFRMKSMGL